VSGLRRAAGIAVAAAVAAGLPVLASGASAATTFAPVFTSSSFTTSAASPESFPTVEARPNHVVGLPSMVKVEFTDPVKLTQLGNGTPIFPDKTAAAPYFLDSTNQQVAATSAVDANDPNAIDVTPAAPLTDGAYTLHVTAFDATPGACDDWSVVNPAPSCTTYDGVVNDDAATPAPFHFTIDKTGPAVVISTVGGAAVPTSTPIDANHVGNVTLTGTTSADTKSLTLSVKSSSGGATRLIPVNITPGSPASWTAHDDLGSLNDGTLTFSVTGKDNLGNASAPVTATVPLAAHPGAPASFSATSRDGGAHLTWSAPTHQTAGHPVTGYVVLAIDTVTHAATTAHTSCGATCPTSGNISGLKDGDVYSLAIAAVTDVGGHGGAAVTTVRPRAATRLTVLSTVRKVHAGHKVALTGRLSTVTGGHSVAGAKVRITPKFANGSTGRAVTVTTDSFGVWSHAFRVNRTTTYVATWAGNKATLPSKGHRKITVF